MERTPTATEYVVFRTSGNAYRYQRSKKEWAKCGESAAVMILADRARNAARIVALTDDNTAVLESALFGE